MSERAVLRSLLAAIALLLLAQCLYAQVFGVIRWKNGTATVSRDTGIVHWTVISSDGSRGYQQRITKLQATGLWMLSRAAVLPDSQRSLPFDYACCRVNFLYSKTSVTGTLTQKGKAGYWQPSKPLTVQQALTVFDWLMYAADSVAVPAAVVDLR